MRNVWVQSKNPTKRETKSKGQKQRASQKKAHESPPLRRNWEEKEKKEEETQTEHDTERGYNSKKTKERERSAKEGRGGFRVVG